MASSREEIARDIVVASINKRDIPLDGKEIAKLYKEVLEGVRVASRSSTPSTGT